MVPSTAISLSHVCEITSIREQGPFQQYLKRMDLKDEEGLYLRSSTSYLSDPVEVT